MNIPELGDLFKQLNTLPLELAILAFFITSSVLILVRDWRASVGALLFQYLMMGFVLARLVRPEIAFAKVLVGLFICLILYISARQSSWRQRLTLGSHGLWALLGARTVAGEVFPPGRAFRVMSLLLMGVIALALAQSYPISNIPNLVSIGIYWLVSTGLLLVILSENPLKVGQGTLTIMTGFELWYTTIEGSLLLVGMWGMVNLLLALAVGYLAAIRGVVLEEEF